jgi:hypothetical protein
MPKRAVRRKAHPKARARTHVPETGIGAGVNYR